VALDIYVNVSQNVTLSVSGGEIHLSGFFEPQRDDVDENMFLEDEDEEDEEDEVEATGGKLSASLKQAKVNAAKNVTAALEDDDEDEEDYDDEDEEDEDEEDSDEEVLKKPT
jgi:hypothetical protein